MSDPAQRPGGQRVSSLAQIGITNPALRERARGIGERLEVPRDCPTPPNCTSPCAPIWIDEMVRRSQVS